jgi:hypothetical protein
VSDQPTIQPPVGLPWVVVGFLDGEAPVAYGPYAYPEDAEAFLRAATAEPSEHRTYAMVQVQHPIDWYQENRR